MCHSRSCLVYILQYYNIVTLQYDIVRREEPPHVSGTPEDAPNDSFLLRRFTRSPLCFTHWGWGGDVGENCFIHRGLGAPC
jgi:hypothetical protein